MLYLAYAVKKRWCLTKTAVLYNPKAGKGLPAQQVMARLSAFFPEDELLVGEPELMCPGLPTVLIGYSKDDPSYLGLLYSKVRALAQAGADRFVCVGGDGTATYVRNALYLMNCSAPILGVAAGTANVGPIVSVTLEQLEDHTVADTHEVCYDGISVWVDDKLVSLAFNDLIVGDTFLATVDGQSCNVCVRELLDNGRLVRKSPSEDIVTPDFRVVLNETDQRPASQNIKQIIISSVAHENHYGRAVYGPIGKCDWCEKKGLIALCDHIAVTFEENDAGTGRFSTMQYLLFGPNDRVLLHGFTENACLVCDGNPYVLNSDRFRVRFEQNLVRTITL